MKFDHARSHISSMPAVSERRLRGTLSTPKSTTALWQEPQLLESRWIADVRIYTRRTTTTSMASTCHMNTTIASRCPGGPTPAASRTARTKAWAYPRAAQIHSTSTGSMRR